MKKLLFCGGMAVAVTVMLPITARAQHQWTLRECCDYAVSHHISIKQQENQRLQSEVRLSNARNARLPDLTASASENFSFGRGLTAENTYTNKSTSSSSLSLGTSVPLFTGFQIPNQIKMERLNLEAATASLEKAKNDVRMQVAQAYVQILYKMEICDVARRQTAIDSMQVVRLQALYDNGKANGAQLSQQQATLANSRLTVTQADNDLALSLLTLTQLLELPTQQGFMIVRPTLGAEVSDAPSPVVSPEVVYAEALGIKPEIQAAQLSVSAAERNINIAKAGYMPKLNLSGGLGSNYYRTSGMEAASLATQLKNNFSQYIGLNLSIPIFNRFQTRNSVRMARLSRDNSQLQLDNTKKTLYKEIQTVCLNNTAARAKYRSTMAASQSSHDAFTLMQAKYENGKANITEFNEAKNNYLKVESDRVQARYELLYQQALLQFYRGRELTF